MIAMKNQSFIKSILYNNKFIFPCLLFACIWIYIFLSTRIFEAGFNYFIDDHQIFIFNNKKFDLYEIIIEPFSSLLSNVPKARFRPLYDILLRLFSQVYGLNPVLWYLSSLIIAITTTTNFYIFARLQSFPILESICFSLLVVFGDQASTYARFGTPETTATFFTSFALIFGSLNVNNTKRHILLDYLFLFFAILAAFNKEACILMLPAFAFFRVWFYSHKNKVSINQSILNNKYIVFFILSIFFLLIAYIKLSGVTGPGYAGVDRETFSASKIFGLINFLIARTSLAFAIVINIIYFILCLKNNRWNAFNGGLYILTGLIVIPQLILYSKSGIGFHYLLPCVVGISFLTVYPIIEIKKLFSKYFSILTLLVLLIAFQNVVATYNHFIYVSNRLNNVQEMVRSISLCLQKESQLIIFGNPYVHYETLYGFKKAIIDHILKSNKDDFFLATYGYSNTNLKSESFKENEKSWNFLKVDDVEGWYNHKTFNTLSKDQLNHTQGIVILGFNEFENDFKKLTSDWFYPDKFNYTYYQQIDISLYCKRDIDISPQDSQTNR